MIPKIIIQTWISDNLPDIYKKSQENIKLLHPDFEYKFFNDDDMTNFIDNCKTFPDLSKTLNKLNLLKIQLIDIFRMIVIYEFGGFYFDMDVLLHSSLHNLLNYRLVIPYEKTYNVVVDNRQIIKNKFGNYGFGAEPKSPVIKDIIDKIIINCMVIPFNNSYDYVYNTTGPHAITSVIENIPIDKKYLLLKPTNWPAENSWHRFGDYGKHIMTGTWKNKHNKYEHYHCVDSISQINIFYMVWIMCMLIILVYIIIALIK